MGAVQSVAEENWLVDEGKRANMVHALLQARGGKQNSVPNRLVQEVLWSQRPFDDLQCKIPLSDPIAECVFPLLLNQGPS